MARNKEQTKARILQAVGKLLAESGFGALGINAIAREAGVDKVLIYRYFEDMPSLLHAFAQESDYLSGVTIPPEMAEANSLSDVLVEFLMYYQKELQDRPITQEIMRWELVDENVLIKELVDIRMQLGIDRLKFINDKFGLPPDKDTVAILTILGAGITYLLLRAKANAAFSDLDFSTPEGWERLDGAVKTIIGALFSNSAPDSTDVPSP
jgi:AcrR family transcriptional regulator